MNERTVVPLDSIPLRGPDYIRVSLHDIKADLNIGVHNWEEKKSQPVIIHIEVEAALPHRYQDLKENSLNSIINYDEFYNFIRNDLPKLGHIPLLETVAEQIINRCFEDCRIRTVRVRIEKPEVFNGGARPSIEMYRTRQSS